MSDHIEKHGTITEDALTGSVELNKHETWLMGTLERLKAVFLKHEKVRNIL